MQIQSGRTVPLMIDLDLEGSTREIIFVQKNFSAVPGHQPPPRPAFNLLAGMVPCLFHSHHCDLIKFFIILKDLHLNDVHRLKTLLKMEATDTANGIAHAGRKHASCCGSGSEI